jgi:hypothetical protein
MPHRIRVPDLYGWAATTIQLDRAGPGMRGIGLADPMSAPTGSHPGITATVITKATGADSLEILEAQFDIRALPGRLVLALYPRGGVRLLLGF